MIFPSLRHITTRLAGVFAVLAALALWSCSVDDTLLTPDSQVDGTVSFRVVTPKYAGSRNASRATWGDSYENKEGIEFETALLDGQVQVEITDAACQQRYAITDLYCKKVEDNPLFVTYEYFGRIEDKDLDALRKVTNGKFHIIANAGEGASLAADPMFARSGRASDFDAIPMWGVKTVDFSKLAVGTTLSIGDVQLLRAMAKVEIDNSKDADNYITSITSVTVSTTNGTGYVLPDAWTSIASTLSLNRHAARVPEQTPSKAKTYKMDENSHVEFYLPEMFNGEGDDEITLTIKYQTILGPMEGKLYIRRYADGNPGDAPLDVLRNYLYHYIVKKPNHEGVEAVLDIIPYSSVELDPDFGLERDPINGWICFRNEQGFLICYFDELNKVFYDYDRQRITYDTHPQHASWLRVIDATGDFKWYFDVETGKMYDLENQEMTGLDRHEVTGWLVRRLPNGKVDYYVAPMANKVYDRNLNEVELESRDGTNNYKLLRDGDGSIIIKFDPLTGKVYDNDDKPLAFATDANGRIIIKAHNGSTYCLYDRDNAKFYAADGQLMPSNPFTNPSWQQFLYSNGSLICYYDQVTGKFFDINLDEITFATHETEPWFRVVDSQDNFCWYLDYKTGAMYDIHGKRINPERYRTTGNLIRRDSKGNIAYYVDPVSLLVYDSGQNLIRLEHRNEKTNAMKVFRFVGAGGPATYFFDAAAGMLWGSKPSSAHDTGFTVDRDNVFYDYNNKQSKFAYDANGRVIIPNDNGGTFRYYDINESKFYTEKGIPVSNPFSTQLTPYDDIKNDAGQFICFYNQTEGKFYDGYMRQITHEEHPTKPWFKVCDHSGNFKWYVDYLTFQLYNSNGTEMTSPALTRKYNNADVRITSGNRHDKTGRVEFIHFRGPVKGTTSYWLDPISLVMYDRTMREVILPHKSAATNSLQQFKKDGALLFDFDVLTCQFYQGNTAKELNAYTTNCVDVITNKKTINTNSTKYQTITGFADVSPARYTVLLSGYNGGSGDLGTDYFRLQSTETSGIVSTVFGGTLKSVTLSMKSGWGATANGVLAFYEKNSKFNGVADMSSLTPTKSIKRDSQTLITYTASGNGYVGIRSTNGNHYFDYVNVEWSGNGPEFYVLNFYNSSGTAVAINYRPYDETFYTSRPLYSANLISKNPFVRQQ